MTALTLAWTDFKSNYKQLLSAWTAIVTIVLAIAIFDTDGLSERVSFAVKALLNTAPYVFFAVVAIAFLKATSAETVVAKAFEGNETRIIVFAALVGGLAPFCSCEVIPFVAALLAAGTPISAVMAFWLSSPLMDPPAFVITTGALGIEFAVAKTVAAVGIGLMGGFVVRALVSAGYFNDPLKNTSSGCSTCCGSQSEPEVNWAFWHEPDRRSVFANVALENGLFLLKWLLLAYLLEAVMIAYVPADKIASIVGGQGLGSIMVGALAGIPAYLNAYAAPALVDALMQQGMSAGAGMAFITAGAMTSIPAMAAVFALVKPQVFSAYIALALMGAVTSGVLFGAYAFHFLV